jgi:transcriptional regulator with XRE-family HTH domain
MSGGNVGIASLINEILSKKRCLPSELAVSIGVSHASVSRWLSGKDVPSPRSCNRLAEFSGVCLRRILAAAGHMPVMTDAMATTWPAFREYAQRKYPGKLDEDLITMIENLIEMRPERDDVPDQNS